MRTTSPGMSCMVLVVYHNTVFACPLHCWSASLLQCKLPWSISSLLQCTWGHGGSAYEHPVSGSRNPLGDEGISQTSSYAVNNLSPLLYAWSSSGRCCSHCTFLSEPRLPIILKSVWWKCSTWPLHCGWYAVVWHFWMPNAAHNSSTSTEVKFGPQSLRNFITINLSHKTLTTVFAIWSFVMMARA